MIRYFSIEMRELSESEILPDFSNIGAMLITDEVPKDVLESGAFNLGAVSQTSMEQEITR